MTEIKPVTTEAPGSPLYQTQIAAKDNPLMRRVWDSTPWMIDADTGPSDSARYMEIMDWCRETFGPEASPLHGHPGNWQTGSVTYHGWTWVGFATEEMRTMFARRWPSTR